MANPEHVEIARSGAAAIAAWREEHPREPLDLCQADLSGCDLCGAPLLMARLSGADLSEALLAGGDLRSCDFTLADLRVADLAEASCSGARFVSTDLRAARMSDIDLRGAELPDADLADAQLARADLRAAHLERAALHRADLRDADLRRGHLRGALLVETLLSGSLLHEAELFETTFARAALDGADFANARCGWTHWLDVDLSTARGLDSLQHHAPSTIGLDTVYRSAGRLPAAFLRGAGVPENFIANCESLAGRSVAFHPCFICHGPPDEAFARRLRDALEARGVRCWLDEVSDSDEDRERPAWGSLRNGDKIVLCASRHLLGVGAARRVIEAALAAEEQLAHDRGVPVEVLLRLDLDGALNSSAGSEEHGDLLRRRTTADFTGTGHDAERFEQQLERLVRVLTAHRAASDQGTLADRARAQVRLLAGRAEGLQSGFDHLVRNDGGNNIWYNFRGEKVHSHHLRQLTAGAVLEWETPPAALDSAADFAFFVFAGAMGYQSQPKSDGFAFLVNGGHAVDFDLCREARAWHSADERVTLFYTPRWSSREDTAGFFYAALARELVTAGQPLRFAVRSRGGESLRWFSLHPEPNAVELQVESALRAS